jgi:hypothetical protein
MKPSFAGSVRPARSWPRLRASATSPSSTRPARRQRPRPGATPRPCRTACRSTMPACRRPPTSSPRRSRKRREGRLPDRRGRRDRRGTGRHLRRQREHGGQRRRTRSGRVQRQEADGGRQEGGRRHRVPLDGRQEGRHRRPRLRHEGGTEVHLVAQEVCGTGSQLVPLESVIDTFASDVARTVTVPTTTRPAPGRFRSDHWALVLNTTSTQ